MAPRRFPILLILRSLAGRRTQSILVAGSIALSSSVVATLLCLSIDVQRKVTEQLAEFGANIALVPAGDRTTFSAAESDSIVARLPTGSVTSPLLYQRGEIKAKVTTPVLVVGVNPGTMAKVISYHLRGQPLPPAGTLASGKIPALVGSRLGNRIDFTAIGLPTPITLIVAGRAVEAEIVGAIATGESEEDQVFVPLPALERLSGLGGRRSALLVRVPGRTEEVTRAVAELGPRAISAGLEAKVLRRVAATGAAALARIRALLMILSAVAVAASLLCAGTVLMEQAIERRGEIGLMKSLGGTGRDVALLLLAEAGFLGIWGGFAGSLLGVGVADLLERVVFNSPLVLPVVVPPITVSIGVFLAATAVILPIRASLAVLPAVALREDRP